METVSESERSAVIEPCGCYTSPLGLVGRLRQVEIKLDMIPVLDLIVIALLVSLVFTRFVMIPGVRVDLPETDLRMQYSTDPLTVLTIENRGMLFLMVQYMGRIRSSGRFAATFAPAQVRTSTYS